MLHRPSRHIIHGKMCIFPVYMHIHKQTCMHRPKQWHLNKNLPCAIILTFGVCLVPEFTAFSVFTYFQTSFHLES